MSDVTIYTKTGCPYCAAAKQHYADSKIAFEEVNVSERPEMKDAVLKLTNGQRAVPVIVENGKVTIGFGGS
jgi:glutaredoxin 3